MFSATNARKVLSPLRPRLSGSMRMRCDYPARGEDAARQHRGKQADAGPGIRREDLPDHVGGGRADRLRRHGDAVDELGNEAGDVLGAECHDRQVGVAPAVDLGEAGRDVRQCTLVVDEEAGDRGIVRHDPVDDRHRLGAARAGVDGADDSARFACRKEAACEPFRVGGVALHDLGRRADESEPSVAERFEPVDREPAGRFEVEVDARDRLTARGQPDQDTRMLER